MYKKNFNNLFSSVAKFQTDRLIDRLSDREVIRQGQTQKINKETDSQNVRLTDRQTVRKSDTDRLIHRYTD